MKLSETDHKILESYKRVTEGLADYLGESYELVLHSLEDLDNSVIAIINGHYTGRKVGSPVTDLALRMLAELKKEGGKDYISYHTATKDGQPLKSTTIAIRGEGKRVIGLLCINLYLNTSIAGFMESVLGKADKIGSTQTVQEEFYESVDHLIASALQDARKQVMEDLTIPSINRNKEIILILYQKGIFNLKDAVLKVAEQLGISKNTVYLHLRGIQKKEN